MLFFIINLLLVLQVLSIGLTIVSERYTYVPYIGLAFMLAMFVSQVKIIPPKWTLGVASLFILVLGIVTFQRTKVWKNSGTLWTNALKYSPRAPYARTNRANYLSKLALRPEQKPFADSIYKVAIEDCRIALSMWPNHAPAFEYRALMHLDRGEAQEALADANQLIRLKPDYRLAYDIRATAHFKTGQTEKALEDYRKCVQLSSTDHRSFYNIGLIFYSFKKYDEAINNLTTAINIHPLGNYYVYRALCYQKTGDLNKAKADALSAKQRNANIPDELKPLLQ
jgi:tetratricopeptide (TPR) repeat protein